MKRPAFKLSAVVVLEEAVDLLRGSPASLLLRYYVGAVPFALAACGFVLDLGRNPAAANRSMAWTLLMAILYLWLKAWHAGFAHGLRAMLGDTSAVEARRDWVSQARYLGWQGTAPWLLTLAAVATVPFAWVYAFFHALSVTGEATTAWHQAKEWPRQNHLLVGALLVLAILVVVNVIALLFMVPMLMDSLLGIETAASQDPGSMFNSTLTVVTIAATYLLVGPVAKAAYVLRAFYGDSKWTGEDLKSRLRRLSTTALLLAALGLGGSAVAADGAMSEFEPAAGPVATGTVDLATLDAALDRELAGSDYDWLRLEAPAERELGLLGRWMQRMADTFNAAVDWLSDVIADIIEWLRAGQADPVRGNEKGGFGLPNPRVLLVLGGLVVLAGLVYVLTRRDAEVMDELADISDAAAVEAALAGDDAAADRLPFDEWLETARQLMAAGDARQAARAVYLATLSYLAHAELLLLARHKSNRDYGHELATKTRRWPEVVPTFSDSVRVIERVWYGRHHAGEGELDRLSSNLETLRELHETG